jgi:simple sugar transport system substrate-binding protein
MVSARFWIASVAGALLALAPTHEALASPQKESISYSAVFIPKFKADWYARLETGLTRAGNALKINVTQAFPSPAFADAQAHLIEDAINRRSNAVFVVPGDPASIAPALALALKKGLVTITHQSPHQESAEWDIEMIDAKSFGVLAAVEMVRALGASPAGSPEGKYAVFVGSYTAPDHNRWADAAIQFIRQKYPDLTLVGERFAVSEDLVLSRETALDLLAAYPGIKAFLVFGSQGGPGAAQAVREKDLVGKVAVIGTTGPDQASPYLKDGSMSASLVWDPAEAGYAMAYVARLVLDGKAMMIGPDMDIPGLGKPFSFSGNTITYNKPVVLTRDNVDTYSGF